MYVKDFDYNLPSDRIAQEPACKRDQSKLLVVNRENESLSQKIFKDIVSFFNKGDVLVLNNTKVLPVRLFARRKTGAKIELLLLNEESQGVWTALIKPSRRIKLSEELLFPDTEFKVKMLDRKREGKWRVEFSPLEARELMYKKGVMPTPPYIKKELKRQESYQTIFAENDGSIACPTSGLHFTEEVLSGLKQKGVKVVYITLHVGLGTFKPIETDLVENHFMDEEYCEISSAIAEIINNAKAQGKFVWGCGTSSVRTLESFAVCDKEKKINKVKPGFKKTDLFIYPGYDIKIVDKLITNFHLPRSTNLFLVASFLGREFLLKSYRYAIENNFRFYSFGDAMVIL